MVDAKIPSDLERSPGGVPAAAVAELTGLGLLGRGFAVASATRASRFSLGANHRVARTMRAQVKIFDSLIQIC